MSTYNCAFTIAFEVSGCKEPDGSDLTPAQLATAIQQRVLRIMRHDPAELLEAVGGAFDSFEEHMTPSQICNFIANAMCCANCGEVFDSLNHPHTDEDCIVGYSSWERADQEMIASQLYKRLKDPKT